MNKVVGGFLVLLGGLISPMVAVAALMGGIANSSNIKSGSQFPAQLDGLGYENGNLPAEALTAVSSHGGHVCRVARVGNADQAWIDLVVAAGLDGVELEGGWCYRSYEAQLSAWTDRGCFIPGNCDGDPYPPTAYPGTSVHGWGLAIDVWGADGNVLACTSLEFLWMQVNGSRFGWVHPSWARCGHLGSEPWHWEYLGN